MSATRVQILSQTDALPSMELTFSKIFLLIRETASAVSSASRYEATHSSEIMIRSPHILTRSANSVGTSLNLRQKYMQVLRSVSDTILDLPDTSDGACSITA